jgi:hypothetical protein
MRTIALAFCLTLFFASIPLQAQMFTAAQKAEIEKAINEQVAALCRTFDTADTEAFIKLWSRERLIGEVASGRLDPSLDSITNRSKNANATVIRRKNEIQDVKIHLFLPDSVFVTCKTLGRNEFKNGNVSNFNWLGTMIWVRESSGWKLAFLGQSSAAIQ